MYIPRLALTPGEPAGIGPDICLMLAQMTLPAEVVLIASPELLQQRATQLGLPLELNEFDPNQSPQANGQGKLSIVPVPLIKSSIAGQLEAANSQYVLKTLDRAVELCLQGQLDAMVTGPVHKAIISQSGFSFSGHTEYLRDLVGVKDVLMTFYTPAFILGMATTHLPLSTVSNVLTQDRLNSALYLLHEGLDKFFAKKQPCIHVLGLNPHAGEEGTIGTEEVQMITPLIKRWQQKGFNVKGPLSADTAFVEKHRLHVDAILAMYHDQGLAPLKALYFGEIVNVTFGLPFLRTSVDHGTALPLAGTGLAEPESLLHAIQLAANQVGKS
ncbi:4-hydroxythreonine-4-phosphate dehydrogenase PdxA [Candidatus Berkiella aquae]|uniref:4-hydroxythreonine-4-phosphate dehydrogenase n=1 Tax=Candidatus Berkiella aquae TaxID=295108 RepID=A0A0Q9YVG5_9GAMM|nr:4-hydroxythreonine-4-phosphate dehydrogenase PdxA [Candidatus Berkiella aquae]